MAWREGVPRRGIEVPWLAFKVFRTEGWPAGLVRGDLPGWDRSTRSGRGRRMSGMMRCQVSGPTGRWGPPLWGDRSSAGAGHGRQLSPRTCTAGPRGSPWLGSKGCGIFLGAIFSFWVFLRANGTRPRCCSWPGFILGGERGSSERGCQLGLPRCALRTGLCGHLM